MHFWGEKPAKNKEKMSQNEFSVLIISMCRIYPKMYYHFYYKEDSRMLHQETNINNTILGLKKGAGWGRGHSPEHLNIVKKRFLSLNMYLSNLFHLFFK